jgi:hypothetical protein
MKNISNLTMAFFATVTLSLVGCGSGGLVSVSGNVTANDQPVAGVRVVFSPKGTAENPNPGHWSQGLTNAKGEFTLVNRNKKNGAVVGVHGVTFQFDDADPDEMEELRDALDEVREEGSKEEFDEVKKRIDEIKQLEKNRPSFSEDFSIEFTVPEGGTKEANFAVSPTKN